MNHSTIKVQIYTSAFWYSTESMLFNSRSLGVLRGHNRVKHIYIWFNGGKALKFSSRYHWTNTVAMWSNGNKEKYVCEILADMTQVSDVAPGPLVIVVVSGYFWFLFLLDIFSFYFCGSRIILVTIVVVVEYFWLLLLWL
jgi:hypothetical protein